MKFLLFLFTILIFSAGCVMGFSNQNRHISEEYSKVYIPAATDTSVYAGNSSRLSHAVRALLATRSDIHFTALEQARWALQIKILDRKQSISIVDNCANPGTPTVASGAYSCAAIHPELTSGNPSAPTSFNQPAVSPQSESIYLVVLVKAIDLNTGAVIWSKPYGSNIPAAAFNEIGDTGDKRTITYLQNTPDMHPLRYQETVENAVQSIATNIATDIQNQIFSNTPH